MSEIDEYLSKIATGVYGRDIRKAIYDGIKLIYDTKSVSIRAMTKSQYDALPEYDSNTLYCIVGEDFVPKLGYDVVGSKYDVEAKTLTETINTTAEATIIVAVMHDRNSAISVYVGDDDMSPPIYSPISDSHHTLDGRVCHVYTSPKLSRGNYTVSVQQSNHTEKISMFVIAAYGVDPDDVILTAEDIDRFPYKYRGISSSVNVANFFVSDNVFNGSDEANVYPTDRSAIQKSMTTPRFQMYIGKDVELENTEFQTRNPAYTSSESVVYSLFFGKEVSD